MAASRRGLLFAIVGALAAARFGATGILRAVAAEVFGPEIPIGDDHVIGLARELSKQAYVPPSVDLPPPLADIGYDLYRSIRFDPNRMFWREEAGFAFDLLHTGFVFRIPVEINVVSDGKQRRISYDPTLFDFSGLPAAPDPKGTGVGYSGLRLRYPLNQPGLLDEFCVFQGASYFRAIGKGQAYGLSARGLAIDTAQPKGEEFPAFRGFWIRMPQPGAMAIVIDALLDSQSVTGAYRFTVRPGETTQIDVELTLFPRTDITHVGVAPLTSMFLFDAIDRTRFDDYRASVHDSDGLAMLTGRGEWLWRPLSNPQALQISAFIDHGPRGFGLMQRKRDFNDYRDLEARYERRPAIWVEPVGDWGAGHVELVEIPSGSEVNDNIVAYWRPKDPIGAGREVRLTYRLYWGDGWPLQGPAPLAQAQSSMSGGARHRDGERRLFVIEFTGGNLDGDIKADVSTGQGQVSNIVSQPNPETGGIRVHFELDPAGSKLAELRVRLVKGSEPVSETWLYRWTA